jgi:DNA modification methylase
MGAHFATMPPELARLCILAGSPYGGLVLDPFAGSGTTGVVAREHGRAFVGCELNPEYVAMAEKRIAAAREQLRLFT